MKETCEQLNNCKSCKDYDECHILSTRPFSERIEPIFRDLFWKRRGGSKMTECNLFDGYCTFECEECPHQDLTIFETVEY